jgi:hypothetical protein
MKNQLQKLIDVKSIITIALTILFIVLSIKGIIDGKEVVNIYTIIIAFYFGTQAQKVSNLLQNNTYKNNSASTSDKQDK